MSLLVCIPDVLLLVVPGVCFLRSWPKKLVYSDMDQMDLLQTLMENPWQNDHIESEDGEFTLLFQPELDIGDVIDTRFDGSEIQEDHSEDLLDTWIDKSFKHDHPSK